MLKPEQEEYLQTIPEDKIARIMPFDPKVKEVSKKVIQELEKKLAGVEIFSIGTSELGIAGQNDIDLTVVTKPKNFYEHLGILLKWLGQYTRRSQERRVKWVFQIEGFEVELYLIDEKSERLIEQIKVFEIFKSNQQLLKEYETIKLSANGLSFREYMRKKYEFFNESLRAYARSIN